MRLGKVDGEEPARRRPWRSNDSSLHCLWMSREGYGYFIWSAFGKCKASAIVNQSSVGIWSASPKEETDHHTGSFLPPTPIWAWQGVCCPQKCVLHTEKHPPDYQSSPCLKRKRILQSLRLVVNKHLFQGLHMGQRHWDRVMQIGEDFVGIFRKGRLKHDTNMPPGGKEFIMLGWGRIIFSLFSGETEIRKRRSASRPKSQRVNVQPYWCGSQQHLGSTKKAQMEISLRRGLTEDTSPIRQRAGSWSLGLRTPLRWEGWGCYNQA